LGRRGIGREKGLEERPWVSPLPARSEDQTGQDTMCLESAYRSGAEHYLAEDHQKANGLFRLIVGRLHAGVAQEGKEVLVVFSDQGGTEVLCGFIGERAGAEVLKFSCKLFFQTGRLVSREAPGEQVPTYPAGFRKERGGIRTKGFRLFIAVLDQGEFTGDL